MKTLEVSEILTVKSYIDTLRAFSKGDIKKFLLVGTDYTGFHNAKTRLNKQGRVYQFAQESTNGETFLVIKRIK